MAAKGTVHPFLDPEQPAPSMAEVARLFRDTLYAVDPAVAEWFWRGWSREKQPDQAQGSAVAALYKAIIEKRRAAPAPKKIRAPKAKKLNTTGPGWVQAAPPGFGRSAATDRAPLIPPTTLPAADVPKLLKKMGFESRDIVRNEALGYRAQWSNLSDRSVNLLAVGAPGSFTVRRVEPDASMREAVVPDRGAVGAWRILDTGIWLRADGSVGPWSQGPHKLIADRLALAGMLAPLVDPVHGGAFLRFGVLPFAGGDASCVYSTAFHSFVAVEMESPYATWGEENVLPTSMGVPAVADGWLAVNELSPQAARHRVISNFYEDRAATPQKAVRSYLTDALTLSTWESTIDMAAVRVVANALPKGPRQGTRRLTLTGEHTRVATVRGGGAQTQPEAYSAILPGLGHAKVGVDADLLLPVLNAVARLQSPVTVRGRGKVDPITITVGGEIRCTFLVMPMRLD